MLTSQVWHLVNGKPAMIGTVSARDGKVILDPDCPTLQRLAEQEIFSEEGRLIGSEDAEAFVRALHLEFKSAYLWAEKAEDRQPKEPYGRLVAQMMEQYAKRKAAAGQASLWDEDAHPRAADGEFAKKSEAAEKKEDSGKNSADQPLDTVSKSDTIKVKAEEQPKPETQVKEKQVTQTAEPELTGDTRAKIKQLFKNVHAQTDVDAIVSRHGGLG